jgi:hypothetical protein
MKYLHCFSCPEAVQRSRGSTIAGVVLHICASHSSTPPNLSLHRCVCCFLSMGACFSSGGLESTSQQPLLRGTQPRQYRLSKTPILGARALQPVTTSAMAAAVDRTTLVPGETVTDLVTRFKALIALETDTTKKAAMEAQLQEKEEAIRNKRYRCVLQLHCCLRGPPHKRLNVRFAMLRGLG